MLCSVNTRGIRCTMREHESQDVPHTEHYVRAWKPGGAAYGAFCASMEAKMCRIRSFMCEHGGQEVSHTEHNVRAWNPGRAAYYALCTSMRGRKCHMYVDSLHIPYQDMRWVITNVHPTCTSNGTHAAGTNNLPFDVLAEWNVRLYNFIRIRGPQPARPWLGIVEWDRRMGA